MSDSVLPSKGDDFFTDRIDHRQNISFYNTTTAVILKNL